jgi:hypothetical protein
MPETDFISNEGTEMDSCMVDLQSDDFSQPIPQEVTGSLLPERIFGKIFTDPGKAYVHFDFN